MIHLSRISKTFSQGSEKINLYSDLSLDITDGEFVMLTGQSGSGKTTLFNIIAGLEGVDSGSVVVNGTNIDQLTADQRTVWRSTNIGFVFQKFHLVPQLTVRENLELPGDISGIQKRDTVENLLDLVGLSKKITVYPDQLSGGEQQRVAIARAFLYNTPLLLADEPTGNLDLGNSENIMQLIKQLQKETGVTIFMITHEQEILTRADRVIRMSDLLG